ncbi:protein unc-13 homolog [Lactuca sativa]|uniref:protein unc-13 homolog n=1 Tax=Lactuca sativa TaxID=4236 RepID=UPI0022AF31E0|nr:protein unc-13 homolog [Lactuca sativa]
MTPIPPSDEPFNPFGHLDLDLSDSELRETAYEIFVGACGSPGGGRLLSYVSHSGRLFDWTPPGPSFQRSLTFSSGSKVKRSLGLNSPKKKKGPGSAPVSPVNKTNQHPTIGEMMRIQMKISDEIDCRVRPALLKIASELVGRRIESIVLPVELLHQFKASDFQTQHEYNEWQRRQLKILELGLLLHPKIPLDKKDSSAQQLSKIIHTAYEHHMVTGKHSEEVKTLRGVTNQLACRSFHGDDSEMCHWADGIPLNLRLYQFLLESLFDIETPTIIINEIDEMLEFIKRTWGILGINQRFHNLCFVWVLFDRFLSTGQVENNLLLACANLLLEIKEDADSDSGFSTQYSKILNSTLMFIFKWAEKGLFGYREFFYRGNVELMHIVLSIGLLADELMVEKSSCDDDMRKIVYETSGKVDTYIRSSMKMAFSQIRDKLMTSRKSTKRQQTNFNQLPALCVIAQEITDLAFTEKEIYSPILAKHHPLPVGVAVATLHSCFGQQVKAFISNITDLTPDVIQVLIAADKMEKCLVQMAVEDSFDSEDGGKSIIQEMSPYETEIVIGDLVKSWIQTRVERLTQWVHSNLKKEVWNPKVNQGQFGQSVVEVLRTISETLEAYFLLPIPLHAALLPDLINGLDKSLQDYIFKAKSTSGSRNKFLPKIPSLSQMAENRTTKDNYDYDYDDDDDSCGILQLCVRVNTFIYIRKELQIFQERVVAQLSSTGSRTTDKGNIVNYYKISFNLSLTACEDGIQELCEVTGYKLVFHELNHVFWKGLYIDGASSSRIEPFLEELEENLEKITGIVHDDSVRTRVITEIMRASCDGFLLVLLAGGHSRNFTLQDSFNIQEDFHLLVDLFWSHGDRLPTELISKFSAPVEGILPLFATDTETLIQQCKALAVDKGGRLPESGEWDRNDPNTILRVLCHRDDRVAFKFLKNNFHLPKNV